jgi:hypothetical protein
MLFVTNINHDCRASMDVYGATYIHTDLVRPVGDIQRGARPDQGLGDVEVAFHEGQVQGRVLVHVREGEVGLFVYIYVSVCINV